MRYYLYRDIEFLKEIYSQFINLDLNLEVIERIDAKTCFEEESMFAEPESKVPGNCDTRFKVGARNSNSSNITTISEYANIIDVKDIYNKRFYHNLIENLKNSKHKGKGICHECGKIHCMRNDKDGVDKFVEINGAYIWFEDDKMSNDIHVVSTITDKIEVVGCIIKDEDSTSPRVIKAIAMYIDSYQGGNNE